MKRFCYTFDLAPEGSPILPAAPLLIAHHPAHADQRTPRNRQPSATGCAFHCSRFLGRYKRLAAITTLVGAHRNEGFHVHTYPVFPAGLPSILLCFFGSSSSPLRLCAF